MGDKGVWHAIAKSQRTLVLMMMPALIGFVLFAYFPIFGIVVAFQNFNPVRGFWNSEWVGMMHFYDFVSDPYFFRIIRNTVLLSAYQLICGLIFPIALALMLNELMNGIWKRVFQSISYLPHFLSSVVVVGLIQIIFAADGPVNDIIQALGGRAVSFMSEPGWFRPLYVGSGIWQSTGWDAIIYLAAMAGINSELYEASAMDGAGRWRRMWHITLPSIRPVIAILLIFGVAGMMNLGFEKVYLMYSPATYETADIIQTYVYRRGIVNGDYSYAAAIGLFNSLVSLILLLSANYASKKLTSTGVL